MNSKPPSKGTNIEKLLISCFGLGWLPFAPGTWGSLPPVVVFVLVYYLGASSIVIAVIMAGLVLLGMVACIRFAPFMIAATGRADPREIVADEFAGQAITFLIIATTPLSHVWATSVLGFLLFRLLDVLKPWPIRKSEKLPLGWGIVVDDLLAGLYAGVGLVVCLNCNIVGYICSYLSCSCKPWHGNLTVFSAMILGTVQGLTEFLPVSSDGHLVLFEHLFGFQPENSQMLFFDLVAHVGTVISMLFVFRKPLFVFLRGLRKSSRGGIGAALYQDSPSVHVLVLAVVTTVVTGVIGLAIRKWCILARGNLTLVAVMWLVTATLLVVTDYHRTARLSLRRFGIIAAIFVGFAQAAAILPGLSRSGTTICVAILIGLRRRWAVEYSFLIAVPAIIGATAIELLRGILQSGFPGVSLPVLLSGLVSASLVGIGALRILIEASRRARLRYFAFYCYALALFVLFYAS